MNETERINQFVANVVRQYPQKNEETEYEKIMKGATAEEKKRAAEILRGQVKYFT